jgi:hypothetical protein
MKKRVRITALPKARTGYQVQGSLANDVPAMGGADYDAYIGKPKPKVNTTLKATSREEANLEAEGGETAVGNLNGNGIPSQKKIVGKRHYEGGVPLNLPEGTFIYSDTNSMKIKDPNMLKMFGKGGTTKGFTPAQLAKQYDIDKYTAILKNTDSDPIERKTAEIMIRNYNMKLGALALAQESKKGFPQGIPGVAAPYLEANNINPDSLLPPDMLGQLSKKNAESEEATMQKDPRELQQVIGQVEQMMQQRMPIEQIVSQMLQSEIDPQDILQAFIELGVPQEQVEPVITGMFAEMQESSRQQNEEMEMPEESQEMPEEPMMRYGGMRELKRFLHGGEDYFSQEEPDYNDLVKFIPSAPYMEEAKIIELPNTPEAEYGMAMGANPQNYMGRRKDMVGSRPMFYESGGKLPKAQDGIEIKRSELEGKTPEEIQNYYQDKWLEVNKGKKKSEQKPIYIIENNGSKTALKTSRTTKKYEGDLAGFNNRQDIADQYQTLMSTLGDPDVKKIFGQYVRKALADESKYISGKGKKYATWAQKGYGNLDDLTDQQIYDYMDEHQRRNYKLYASGREASFYGDANEKLRPFDGKDGFWERAQKLKKPDGTTYTKEEAKKLHEKLSTEAPTLTKARQLIGEKYVSDPKSPGYTEDDRKAIYAMQGSFQGYNDLVNDYNAGKFDNDPNLKRKMSGLIGQLERGAADEGYGATGRISNIDGYDTDTTGGQLGAAGLLTFEEVSDNSCTCADGSIKEKVDGKCPCEEKVPEETAQAKKCKCQKADGSVYEVVAPPDYPKTPCPCETTQQVPVQRQAPGWLQDTIKTTGAFGDLMGIKKHMPWEAPVMLERPKPVFMSPEREMANLNEQTKIATDALSQFAGPQAASARASSIFGQGAKEAAGVLQRYNNYNVNLANQFELKSTDIANQENMLKQARGTALYDKNTIANQQYDNAKLAMRNQLRNYYTNAITNRWKTDALNQMYPQFEVDPSVGGRLYFDELAAKRITPSGGGSNADFEDRYNYWQSKGLTPSEARQNVESESKVRNVYNTPATSSGNEGLGMIQAMYGKKGGTMKKGGYVYADILYPFIL